MNIHYEFGDKLHLQESTPLEDISFYNVTIDNLRKASVFKDKALLLSLNHRLKRWFKL